MKNKFEALASFQSWPKEWQRLCAEFWAETEETQEVRFDARQLAIDPPQRLAKAFRRFPWTAKEDDYLHKCVAEHAKLGDAVRQFLSLHPGRSTDSIRRRAWGMQKGTVS